MAATGLVVSVAVLVVAIVGLLLRGGGDGVAAAPSPSVVPTQSLTPDPSGWQSPPSSPAVPGSPGPTNAPVATPLPPAVPAVFPVKGYADSVLMTPGPEGGIYVVVPRDDGAIAALVRTDGSVRAGWPVELGLNWCQQVLTARDGTLRTVCEVPPQGDGLESPVTRVFGFDATGRVLPGWPVDVEGSMYESGAPMAAIDGDELTVVLRQYTGDTPDDAQADPARLAIISATGGLQVSDPIEVECCDGRVVPGRGVAFLLNRDYFGEGSTQVTALDVDRVRWQTTIDSILSNPSFDRAGNAYFTTSALESATNRVVTLDPSGRVIRSTEDLPSQATGGYSGAGHEYPGAPIVAPDGSFFVVGFDEWMTIMAFDARSRSRTGWSAGDGFKIAQQGYCDADSTGCGTFDVVPQVGPDGTLYVATQPGEVGGGGSLRAIRSNGAVSDGWPVGLRRGGATFWNVIVGSDGGVWALAAEPEGTDKYSGTLLSIAPDSTVRGRITIFEPENPS